MSVDLIHQRLLADPAICSFGSRLLESLGRLGVAQRKRALKVPLSAFPEYAAASSDDERDYRCSQLLYLAECLGAEVEYAEPARAQRLAFERRPRLVITERAERSLSAWLKPAQDPQELRSAQLIKLLAGEVPEPDIAPLLCVLDDFPDRAPEEIHAALQRVRHLSHLPGLGLRELSAMAFWGVSKVFEGRDRLKAVLLGADFEDRPLVLPAYAPAQWDQILFVENLSTFFRVCANPLPATAVIYAQGFKASAGRTRSKSGHRLYLDPLESSGDAELLSDQLVANSIPMYFWGDMDWAGLEILRALREAFPGLSSWRPGYEPMLRLLRDRWGHTYVEAGKQGQREVAFTGCPWADAELLPILKLGLALDQECVDFPIRKQE